MCCRRLDQRGTGFTGRGTPPLVARVQSWATLWGLRVAGRPDADGQGGRSGGPSGAYSLWASADGEEHLSGFACPSSGVLSLGQGESRCAGVKACLGVAALVARWVEDGLAVLDDSGVDVGVSEESFRGLEATLVVILCGIVLCTGSVRIHCRSTRHRVSGALTPVARL